MPTACAPCPLLPPRDVLLAQVVGTMAAPITGLVTVLQGTHLGLRSCAAADRGTEDGGRRSLSRRSNGFLETGQVFDTFNDEVN